jgi:GntR family transcriptional regulator
MIIEIDNYSEKPLYEQLRDSIILGVASGWLAEGESLPSARSLAADLGVNFHTVNKAYDALRAGGYIVMDRRKVATIATAEKRSRQEMPKELTGKLELCMAEAICNGFDEKAALGLCTRSFRKIKGGQG